MRIIFGILHLLVANIFLSCLAVDYNHSHVTYPCASSCGDEKCFASSWDVAADISRNLTEGCEMVLYSIAISDRVDKINNIENYWKSSMDCSILFLSEECVYLRRHPKATKIGNWTIVPVSKLEGHHDSRKSSKIPKISPGKFMASSVKTALYIDAKLSLLMHPTEVHQIFLRNHTNVLMAAISHPAGSNYSISREVKSIKHELDTIRPHITHNLTMLQHQKDVYLQHGILGTNMMVDSCILLHQLQFPAFKEFTCMWLQQVLRYSDRDQISFPGAVHYFAHSNNDTIIVEDDTRRVALDMTEGRFYLHMLPRKYWRSPFKPISVHRFFWNG